MTTTQTKTTKVLLVRADGTSTVEQPVLTLAYLQEKVGGSIEVTSGGTEDGIWSVYLNDEGKINGLPANERATRIARALNWQGMRGDVFAGDVLFLGPSDENGDDTDVPQFVLDAAEKIPAPPEITLEWLDGLERRDTGRKRDYRGELNRTVSTEWVLGATDGGTLVVRLSTGDSADRKEYFSTLYKSELRPSESGFSVERTMLFNSVSVQRTPRARFSAKGLDEAQAIALRNLRASIDLGLLTDKAKGLFDLGRGLD